MDFFSTISNIRSLRAACRDLSLSELEAFANKLNEIVEERQQEDEELCRKLKEKENAISSIKTLMSQVGISSEELNALLEKGVFTPQVKSRNVPPKYRFSDEFGNSHTWTGQGRTPTIFVECMKREGKNRDDYLI
jgi:DNA-binding protein H-NS